MSGINIPDATQGQTLYTTIDSGWQNHGRVDRDAAVNRSAWAGQQNGNTMPHPALNASNVAIITGGANDEVVANFPSSTRGQAWNTPSSAAPASKCRASALAA